MGHNFRSQFALCILVAVFNPVTMMIPQGDRDDLIRYYFNQGNTWKEICGFLLFSHNIVVSLHQMKRIMKRLKLKRYRNSSPLPEILRALVDSYQRGYSNAGYKTLWRVINSTTDVRVSQETVRLLIGILDPEGVQLRSRNRLRRRAYVNRGPNYLIHIDGYDKLKPYGICIHGGIDGFSRRLLWLEASYSNNDPRIVARYYLDFVRRSGRCPRLVRGDGGTENVLIRDMQVAFRFNHGDSMSATKSYLSGRSTGNQRIERFWVNLRSSFASFWRNLFRDLSDMGKLDIGDPVHVECLRFCFLPLIQKDLDMFLNIWNQHRIRSQRNGEIPSGIPNVLYYQPAMVYSIDYSFPLPCDLETLDRIRDMYTIPKPTIGCSDEFVQLMEELTGIERTNIPQPQTVESAVNLFTMITEILSTY